MSTIRLKNFILDLLFPKKCLGCKKEGIFFCAACLNDINDRVEIQRCSVCSQRNFSGVFCSACQKYSSLKRLLFALSYKDPIARDLIHACKYHSIREAAVPMGKILLAILQKNCIIVPRTAIVVPIPLHPYKLRRRGFNQAELIASVVAEECSLKIVSENLYRKLNTESQIEFPDFSDRKKNMAGAFGVRQPVEFAGKKILLIDDVSTSRATLDAAAGMLKEAGAKSVWGMVVAKG